MLIITLQLNVSWVGMDSESAPMYYEVCLGSTAGSSDVMPCTSTDGHETFVTYHLNIESLQTFYLQLSAVNKAGLETTKVKNYCSKIHVVRFVSLIKGIVDKDKFQV